MIEYSERVEIVRALWPSFSAHYQDVIASKGTTITNITPPNIKFRRDGLYFIVYFYPRSMQLVHYPGAGVTHLGCFEYKDPDSLQKIHDAVRQYPG